MPRSSDVTVVVPAYQAESFLPATLATVAQQTALPFELIVVDDGSTDDTCNITEIFALAHPELRMRLLREPHRGPGAARNAGVRAARSDWIAFLDSDDLWHPSKLESMLTAMRAHPDANIYCHNEAIRSLDGSQQVTDYGARIHYGLPLARQLFRNNCFSTSAVVCRRELVLRCGGFDETLSSAQDYDLWLRMSPDLVPRFVPEVLGTYVLREGNISTSRYWRRLLNILRVKHRHRAKGGALLYLHSMLRETAHHVAGPALAAIKGLRKRNAARSG